jgi:hypothetical protein
VWKDALRSRTQVPVLSAVLARSGVTEAQGDVGNFQVSRLVLIAQQVNNLVPAPVSICTNADRNNGNVMANERL